VILGDIPVPGTLNCRPTHSGKRERGRASPDAPFAFRSNGGVASDLSANIGSAECPSFEWDFAETAGRLSKRLQGRIRKPHRLQTRLDPCGRGWARNSLPDLRGLMLSEGNFSQCRSESCFRELGMRMVSRQRNCYSPLFGFRAARERSRGTRSSHLSRMLSLKSAQLPQVVRLRPLDSG
jgi:hypothetical protein